MTCKICNQETTPVFEGKILNKYQIKYYYCDNCGFLQTEEPYWLDEAYKTPINISDTGYLQRNIELSKKLTILIIESFEHFVNPIEEIENILSLSKNIIFTTELLPYPLPKPEEWWYYGLDHGQHISFYSLKTFEFIAKKYNLNYYNSGNLHLLTEKNISRIKLKMLKLTRFGLHKILQRQMKSKTWEDYLKYGGRK